MRSPGILVLSLLLPSGCSAPDPSSASQAERRWEDAEPEESLRDGSDKADLEAAVAMANGLLVRHGYHVFWRGEASEGTRVAGRDAVVDVLAQLEFQDRRSQSHCGCTEGYTLAFLERDTVVAHVLIKHGGKLLWSGWEAEPDLTSSSRQRLARWFDEHGLPGPLPEEWVEAQALDREEQRVRRFWSYFPLDRDLEAYLRRDPEGFALSTLRALGAAARSDGLGSEEQEVLALLGRVEPETLMRTSSRLLLADEAALVGLGMLEFRYASLFPLPRLPLAWQQAWYPRLTELFLQRGARDQRLALAKLRTLDTPEATRLLEHAFETTALGGPEDRSVTGPRVEAALGLALRGKREIEPELRRLLASETLTPQDRAGLEAALATLGDAAVDGKQSEAVPPETEGS